MTLRDQIQQVIDDEPVAVFMKGTPQPPACGNSQRALQALWSAGAPITAVDILPDPAIRQELSGAQRLADDPAGVHQGRADRWRGHHRGAVRLGRAGAEAGRRARRDRERTVKVVAVAGARSQLTVRAVCRPSSGNALVPTGGRVYIGAGTLALILVIVLLIWLLSRTTAA